MDKEKTNLPDEFEFECPQFADFTGDLNTSEEFCQGYFDKKHEEIKRKSAEFQKQTMMDVDTDNDGGNSSENDKENQENQAAPSNLMAHSDFSSSNQSFISNKSTESNVSHIPMHCQDRQRKMGKNRVAMTTEQMEMRKLEEKKSEFEKLKQQNAKHVAKMRDDGAVFHPTRSTKLTIPITPALHTTVRAQTRLRKERKRKMSAQTADEHAKHCQHPPNRGGHHNLHSHSQEEKNGNNQISKKQKPPSHSNSTKLVPTKTIPKSFKLSKTKRRRASSAVLSTEQKEMREIEKRGTFHARKLNPKIFKSSAGNMGILNNIKNKMTTTTFQPFNLRTEQRAHKYEGKEMKEKSKEKLSGSEKREEKENEKKVRESKIGGKVSKHNKNTTEKKTVESNKCDLSSIAKDKSAGQQSVNANLGDVVKENDSTSAES